MIRVLFGDNSFLRRQRLSELVTGADVEYVDGEQIGIGELKDLIGARSLFSSSQLIVIRDLGLNSQVWPVLSDIKIDDDTTVILDEQKLDKRTKTYKYLQKQAKLEEFKSFDERDYLKAESWLIDRAKKVYSFNLEPAIAKIIVQRLGVDMGRLDNVLTQLSLKDKIDEEFIDNFLPIPKSENVFELLNAALNGRSSEVQKIIAYSETASGPDGAYMTMGLIVSQVINIRALLLTGGDSVKVANDFSTSPYALRQLESLAGATSIEEVDRLINALAAADEQMKTTVANPWLLLELALLGLPE